MSQFREPWKQRLFQHHNVHSMCRVYPRALPINSLNFNPNLYWRHGVQMVAMNYQTYDMNMQINEAMFAAGSDRSGYVLKPNYLRNPRISASTQDSLKLNCQEIKVSVTIISVHQLSTINTLGNNDKINSIVRIQASTPEDGINSRGAIEPTATVYAFAQSGSHYGQRVEIVHNTGQYTRSPSMINLSFKTSHPELVFLHFDLYRSSKRLEKLAVFTAKLNRLCGGYRYIPLYDKYGRPQQSFTIFCNIRKHPPVSIYSAFGQSSVDQIITL
jgi:phosphatidylinositol phospholipase C delta